MKENLRIKGSHYEDKACEYLIQKGYHILERNYRCRIGEIDIIATWQHYIIFVEVKYRKSNAMGDPAEAVNSHKMYKISKVADYYCMNHHLLDNQCLRFDVLAILQDTVTHYENAFQYMGR